MCIRDSYWYDIVTRKEYRVKVIRRVGPHQVEDQDGNLVQVTESVTFEASPPMGTPVIYICLLYTSGTAS